MRTWWAALDRRERLLVGVACAFVIAAVVYAGIWAPLSNRVAELSQRVERNRTLVDWLHEIGPRAAALRASAGTAPKTRDRTRSLLTIVDRTSKQAGLDKAVKRIQPEGDTRVRVWLDHADFDATVGWLFELEQHYDVHTESARISAEDKGGGVSARLSLERPST